MGGGRLARAPERVLTLSREIGFAGECALMLFLGLGRLGVGPLLDSPEDVALETKDVFAGSIGRPSSPENGVGGKGSS